MTPKNIQRVRAFLGYWKPIVADAPGVVDDARNFEQELVDLLVQLEVQ